MNELVSIIVTVYNIEKYIEKCLLSIMSQTYNNIEIIVVNDGSTDKSGEIIEVLLKKEPRLRYIYQDNKGLSGARNAGICESLGEYLLFVDGDDWIESNAIEILMNAIHSDNSDMCIYNMRYVYPDGTEKKNTPKILKHETLNAREALRQELLGVKYKFHAPNKIVKKILFTEHDIWFPERRLYEDLSTTYKLISNANKISLINNYLYFYLQNRKGSITTHNIHDKMFNDLFIALNDVVRYVKKLNWGLDDEIQSVYLENIISISNYFLDNSEISRNYYIKMKSDKNWYLMDRVLLNKNSSDIKKVRGFLINHCWIIYSFAIRLLKGI